MNAGTRFVGASSNRMAASSHTVPPIGGTLENKWGSDGEFQIGVRRSL
jgi:hypothetical protein